MRLILREATHDAHAVQVPDSMPPELRIPVGDRICAGRQFFGEDFSYAARRFLLQRRENIFGQGLFQYEEESCPARPSASS